MKIAPKQLILTAAAALLALTGGCLAEIGVKEVSPAERSNYTVSTDQNGISRDSANLLANFLLTNLYTDDPPELIAQLKMLFKNEPRPEFLCALADLSLIHI